MKKILVIILLNLAVAAFADTSNQTLPPNTVYKIDIVAFKNTQGLQAIPTQQWQPFQPMALNDAIVLDQASVIAPIDPNQPVLYQALPKTQFILSRAVNHIKYSKLFSLIIQQAWLQEALSPLQSQTIMITAGQNYATNMGTNVWELTGSVRIAKSLYQYLNLQVNFQLTEPTQDNQSLQSLYLQETRRIIPNQLNYIDSPGFGLLIEVVPLNTKNPVS